MTNEVTPSENHIHNSRAATWRSDTFDWACTECRKNLTATGRNVSGRESISDPPTIDEHLKPIERPFPPLGDFLITFDYAEAEQAIIEAFGSLNTPYGSLDVPGYDNWCD